MALGFNPTSSSGLYTLKAQEIVSNDSKNSLVFHPPPRSNPDSLHSNNYMPNEMRDYRQCCYGLPRDSNVCFNHMTHSDNEEILFGKPRNNNLLQQYIQTMDSDMKNDELETVINQQNSIESFIVGVEKKNLESLIQNQFQNAETNFLEVTQKAQTMFHRDMFDNLQSEAPVNYDYTIEAEKMVAEICSSSTIQCSEESQVQQNHIPLYTHFKNLRNHLDVPTFWSEGDEQREFVENNNSEDQALCPTNYSETEKLGEICRYDTESTLPNMEMFDECFPVTVKEIQTDSIKIPYHSFNEKSQESEYVNKISPLSNNDSSSFGIYSMLTNESKVPVVGSKSSVYCQTDSLGGKCLNIPNEIFKLMEEISTKLQMIPPSTTTINISEICQLAKNYFQTCHLDGCLSQKSFDDLLLLFLQASYSWASAHSEFITTSSINPFLHQELDRWKESSKVLLDLIICLMQEKNYIIDSQFSQEVISHNWKIPTTQLSIEITNSNQNLHFHNSSIPVLSAFGDSPQEWKSQSTEMSSTQKSNHVSFHCVNISNKSMEAMNENALTIKEGKEHHWQQRTYTEDTCDKQTPKSDFEISINEEIKQAQSKHISSCNGSKCEAGNHSYVLLKKNKDCGFSREKDFEKEPFQAKKEISEVFSGNLTSATEKRGSINNQYISLNGHLASEKNVISVGKVENKNYIIYKNPRNEPVSTNKSKEIKIMESNRRSQSLSATVASSVNNKHISDLENYQPLEGKCEEERYHLNSNAQNGSALHTISHNMKLKSTVNKNKLPNLPSSSSQTAEKMKPRMCRQYSPPSKKRVTNRDITLIPNQGYDSDSSENNNEIVYIKPGSYNVPLKESAQQCGKHFGGRLSHQTASFSEPQYADKNNKKNKRTPFNKGNLWRQSFASNTPGINNQNNFTNNKNNQHKTEQQEVSRAGGNPGSRLFFYNHRNSSTLPERNLIFCTGSSKTSFVDNIECFEIQDRNQTNSLAPANNEIKVNTLSKADKGKKNEAISQFSLGQKKRKLEAIHEGTCKSARRIGLNITGRRLPHIWNGHGNLTESECH